MDKDIREYYINSTKNFIRKINKKHNEERKKINFTITKENSIILTNDKPNYNPNHNLIITILFFCSVTTVMYVYYK
jgi:hypothetical protein